MIEFWWSLNYLKLHWSAKCCTVFLVTGILQQLTRMCPTGKIQIYSFTIKLDARCSCRDPGIFRLKSPYEFPDKTGKTTSKWLYVQRGTSPRLMPMTLVSNHGITEDEFRSWQIQCDKDNRPQITLAEVEEVQARLKDAQKWSSSLFPPLNLLSSIPLSTADSWSLYSWHNFCNLHASSSCLRSNQQNLGKLPQRHGTQS